MTWWIWVLVGWIVASVIVNLGIAQVFKRNATYYPLSSEVILTTDPDREREAIATTHLNVLPSAQALKMSRS